MATLTQRYKGALSGAKGAVKAMARAGKAYMSVAFGDAHLKAIEKRQMEEDMIKEEQARNMRSRYYQVPKAKK